MIVYLESNFVLEVAYRQEEVSACEAILGLKGQLDLRVPAVCICEPYFRHLGRIAETEKITQSTSTLLTQLRRSARYTDRANTVSHEFSTLVSNTNDLDKAHLDMALKQICEIANLIPLSADVLGGSQKLQAEFGLKPLDALIVASVLADLSKHQQARPKVFVSRDRKMFYDPQVRELLSNQSCKIITKFTDGEKFIRSML